MMIDLFRPFVPKEAAHAVSTVLKTRWIGQGPKVDEFERVFRSKFGQEERGVVALNSGTAALETAYELLNLKPGDEVITTPLTCTATNLPLLIRGVKIVWADIEPETLCIDPEDIARKVTSKTKAIVQVHLGGIDSGIENWSSSQAGRIPVVSDACQALGIFRGDYNCFSFQAIKHITTGDGGMLVCPKPQEREAKLRRWFGIDREKKTAENWQAYKERKMTFDIEIPGTKRQMNDIAAGMGLGGLKRYDDVIGHRSILWHEYVRRLSGKPGIKIVQSVNRSNTYWLMTVLVERRDDFARMMTESQIDVNTVHVRNDIYKVFGGKREDLPTLNALEEKYICLPIGMHITLDDVNFICDAIEGGW